MALNRKTVNQKMTEAVKVRVLRSFFMNGEIVKGENEVNRDKKNGKPVHAEIPRWLAIELAASDKVSFELTEEVEINEQK